MRDAPGRPVRIPPVDHPTDEQAMLLQATLLSPDAAPLNLFRTLVRHPALLKRTNVLAGLFMTKNLVPPRDREIVILRVAIRSGCEYEYRQHAEMAITCGLTADDISALHDAEPVHNWSPSEWALIQLTDSLVEGFEVSDEIWSELAARFSEQQLMELTMLVGFYRMLAGVMNSLGIPVDER
jgi:4-carboxymuconolactone decarboxylase